jgi:hypothetical protein
MHMDDVMDIMVILTVITFLFGIVVLLPLLIRYLDRYDKRLKLFLLIPVIFIGVSVYTAIYPNDEFYQEDFREITGLEFPKDGDIIFKIASYPDQHGDYGSASIIKITKDFDVKLERQLIEKGFKENLERHGSNELDQAVKKIGDKAIEREFSSEHDGHYYYVAFLSGRETIIVNRQSW